MFPEFFDQYVSNTIAGSGNQYVFHSDGEKHTARIFYRLTEGGTFVYSLLFGNTIEGTFSDGTVSRANDKVTGWQISDLKLGICSSIDNGSPISLRSVTIEGKNEKTVEDEDILFATDPMQLSSRPGDFLCLQLSYAGEKLPNHEESIISAFLQTEEGWIETKQTPYPIMVGCSRDVSGRVAFLGDSITQGIGVAKDSYAHWNAVLMDLLKKELPAARDLAFWNLGLGFGEAADAASDGIWLHLAMENEYVVLCYGVNDLYLTNDGGEKTMCELTFIVDKLKAAGVKVLIQTVPPFDYEGRMIEDWHKVNDYIRNTLSGRADGFFDTVPVLGDVEGGHPERAPFGGHPNEKGSKAWGEALLPEMIKLLLQKS